MRGLEMTEESVSELNDTSTRIKQSEEKRKTKFKKQVSDQRPVGQYQEVYHL